MIGKRNSWMSMAFLFAALLFIYAGHANGAAILSDDFNSSTANPVWRFYDPYDTTGAIDPGESTLTFNGTNALISIPAGLTHDFWSNPYNKAPRLLQPADNTDFGIQVKFDSTVSKQYQLQGIVVQQTNDIFLRFDIVHNGTSPQVFAAYLNGADSTVYTSEAIPSTPAYLRVIRTGNQWTYQYSNDGSTWVDAVTFLQPITVTEVGFFAGAHTPSPAFLASVDYFMNLNLNPNPNPTDNNVSNPGFESGISSWLFYSNTSGVFDNAAAGSGSPFAGHVTIGQAGSNIQLYQSGIVLEANTQYRLTFMAYSNTGHDVSVSLNKHGAPYTNYGLSDFLCNLTTSWASCSVQFNTSGFSGTVNDGRLMFWLAPYAAAGDQYFFDDVVLEKVVLVNTPVITTQPVNQSVIVGQTATFSVAATSSLPLSYQWKRNGTNIAGATSASYTTPATILADSGSIFACTVSNTAGSISSSAATLTVTTTTPPITSLLLNPGFESGVSPWLFYSNTSGVFDNAAAGSGSPFAGHVTIGQAGSNIQLYQSDIVLEANTQYRLTFMAYSNTGHDVSVSLQKHGSPYTNYGLSNSLCNLTTSWAGCSVQFNTSGFSGTVNDGRLMFWLAPYAAAGDQYFFDDVVLEKVVLINTPVITTQPVNQSVIVGQTATFSVTVTSSLPLSYQWKRNGTNIAGATSASYTTPATILADSGSIFACTVSNTAGSISSSAATLTVTTTIPPITSLLLNPGFEFGAAPWVFYTNTSGSFNNNAAGNGSAHSGHISIAQAGSNVQLYQSDIVLEANAQYRLTFMAYSNTGHDVSVSLQKHGSPYTNYGLSNSLCNLTNSWAGCSMQFNTSGFSGTVNDGRLMFWLAPYAAAADEYFLDDVTLEMIIPTGPPVITAQPSNRAVVVGQSAGFSVTATGAQPMSYQWKRNGTNIAGATGASYTTPATVLADSGAVFTCKISNSAGNVTSNAATLTVSAATSQNITLFDIVYTHSTTVVPIPEGESGKAFSFFDFPAGMPTNFVSPINYSLGRVYERLEVLTKPTNIGVHYQMCMFQDETISSKHVCGPEFSFTTTGVYEINDPLSNWFQYYNIDWNRNLLLEMLVVKDAAGAPVDDRWGFGGYWIGSPDLSLYYPMQVRFRAVLVPPGGTFPGW